MAERLLSVGLDVGTTTTQLIVSEIAVENRASGFCVPEMDITGRKILYESPVRFTPLVGENLVDGDAIARFVEEEYKNAGVLPGQVDTGAVIVTGETSRRENAAAVLEALSGLAGDFVVATAGPDLESVLAAKGAGAVEYSEKTGKTVLHMDIGGGTSNLALIRDGKIVATGCLNVGGRLVKVEAGRITYVSTVVESLWATDVGAHSICARVDVGIDPYPGTEERADMESAPTDSDGRFIDPSSVAADAAPPSPQGEGFSLPQSLRDSPLVRGGRVDARKMEDLAQVLVQALEMAAGLREVTPLLEALWTTECQEPVGRSYDSAGAPMGTGCVSIGCGGVSDPTLQGPMEVGEDLVISFSGGVAECIGKDFEPFAFGDMGPILGRAIRKSRLCRGEYMLGSQTIRATVIGAGCHSAQLSGSTVFCQNVVLPMKNLSVAVVAEEEQLDAGAIARRLAQTDAERAVLAVPGFPDGGYEQVARLADAIIKGFGEREILVCLERDMAKALGQRIALQSGRPCLCIDRVRLSQGSYLDVGQPVGPCLPVVVKTLVLNRVEG